MGTYKHKNFIELQAMNTKNLLAYYQAERKRFNVFSSNNLSDSDNDVDEYMWDQNPEKYEKEKNEWLARKNYLLVIKALLDSRENVVAKPKPRRTTKKV